MSRIEQVSAEINKLRLEYRKLKEIEDTKLAKEFIGRYFKGRNNYSLPEGPEDCWNFYIKVTHFKGSMLCGIMFEIDKDGRATMDPQGFVRSRPDENYQEITEDAWNTQWGVFQAYLHGLSTKPRGVIDEATA